MEELSLLGNVAAVPIIIGITQFLKKNFSFKHKSDVVSFCVSLVVCPLWWFWHTPDHEIIATLDGGVIAVGKFIMSQLLISVATFMSASKSYDIFSGNKKRTEKHTGEKDKLLDKIAELEQTVETGGGPDNGMEDNSEIRKKLFEILEGR
jgi:hypothetical protein